MKRISIICLALIASLLLGALSACRSAEPTPTSVPTNDPTAEPTQTVQALQIVQNGVSEYRIIRSDLAGKTGKANAMALNRAVTEKTGLTLTLTTDWDKNDVQTKEIIVGEANRTAFEDVPQAVEGRVYIQTVGEAVLIYGCDEDTTAIAVEYFIEKYMQTAGTGSWQLPLEIREDMSVQEIKLAADAVGSPLKKQYSDYVKTYTETQLLSFDEAEIPGIVFQGCEHTVDTEYAREGDGALRLVVKNDHRDSLITLLWQDANKRAFQCSVPNRKTCTLKVWVYVDHITDIRCDHDQKFGDYPDQATFFFRALDNKNRTWCWNHTLTGEGWHEVELSFNIHNGYHEDFDFSNITGFGLLVCAKEGTMIELDDLRLVEYQTDYVPETLENGDRLITNAEYDALDGAIIQEWYGASYDLEDAYEGKSSLRNCGDSSVSDFRTIVANLDIPLDYSEDVLVFWMKVERLSTMSGIFIELNQVQDTHEYEKKFSMSDLKTRGLTKNDTWTKIVIPLSDFSKNLKPDQYGNSEDIVLHNFRFVGMAEGTTQFDLHVDHVYITTKTALGLK